MTKCYYFFAILLTLGIIVSCDNDDDNSFDPTPQPTQLNLKALEVGQLAKYVRLTGNCGWAEGYEYTNDTLLLEVKRIDEQLTFEESFTKGSPLYESNQTPITYPVYKGLDMIMIPERSASTLFFFYGNDTIKTAPVHEVELAMSECDQVIDGVPFTGDQIGLLKDFEIHDVNLNDQTVVSCVPMIIDLKAFLMYRNGQLNMSYTLNSGFPGLFFQGWRLLEE